MSLILKAADLARRAHEGQVRKYTGRPYVEHPARVAGKIGLLQGVTEEMVAAAYLHDVLEDTQATFDDIGQQVSPDVAVIVGWLTNPSKGRKDLKREERKAMDREHLAKAPLEIKVIKMADRIDNLLEMAGAPWDFKALYAYESILLAEVIGAAHLGMKADLEAIATAMKKEAALPESGAGTAKRRFP